MTVFLTLFKNDIKLFLKDWKACVLLLAAPFVFISFFTYALAPYLNRSNFVEPFSIALVDQEDTPQTRMLTKQLDEMQIFREVVHTGEAEALQMLSEGSVASVIIIPPDFTYSVAYGENKPVTVIGSSARPLQSFIVKTLMQSAANLVSAAQNAITTIYHYNQEAGLKGKELDQQFNDSTMAFFLEALARNEVFSRVEAYSNFDLTPVEYFTAALMVIFAMFAGMPGMKMLVTERTSGITKRLAAAPVKMWQIILSKLLVSIVLVTLQFGFIILLTAAVFKNYWGAPVGEVLLLFGGLVFAVCAWSVFVAAISRTSASADAIGNLGILTMAVIGGSIYPLSSMPEFVRGLSRLTINRWAMDGFMVLFSGNEALHVGPQALMLVVIGAVLSVLAAGFMKLMQRRQV